jgi:hypothetical protein
VRVLATSEPFLYYFFFFLFLPLVISSVLVSRAATIPMGMEDARDVLTRAEIC